MLYSATLHGDDVCFNTPPQVDLKAETKYQINVH